MALLAIVTMLSPAALAAARDTPAGPVTFALAAVTVRQDNSADFSCRIDDASSATATVSIVVQKLDGTPVTTLDVADPQQTNTDLSLPLQVAVAPGEYQWLVYATDGAGLTQTQVGSNTLTVKQKGPVTKALGAVKVRQTLTCVFHYRVNDTASTTATVRLVVTKKGGATALRMRVAKPQPTNSRRAYRLRMKLPPGKYTWSVYATAADGAVQMSVGSNRLTVLPAPFPSASAIARAVAYLRGRNSDAALAVVDSAGALHGYSLDRRFTSASVVKAMLLVQYLRTHATLTASARSTLTLMITQSNNAAAFATYAAVGAHGLYSLAKLAGMRHFTAGGNVLYSRITAADQARFFFHMDSYIPAAKRSFARYLLSHIVASQSWGISQVARPAWNVFFKGGWFGAAADPFTLVNQVARLERPGVTWSLAVLSDHNPHSPYAFVTLEGVTSRLLGK
jgi:hypothetical protein